MPHNQYIARPQQRLHLAQLHVCACMHVCVHACMHPYVRAGCMDSMARKAHVACACVHACVVDGISLMKYIVLLYTPHPVGQAICSRLLVTIARPTTRLVQGTPHYSTISEWSDRFRIVLILRLPCTAARHAREERPGMSARQQGSRPDYAAAVTSRRVII